MTGLLGKKLGMTQIFGEKGELISVTVLQVGPCVLVQKKTVENDGYHALQLGFEKAKQKRLNKARAGHFAKRGIEAHRYLTEYRTDEAVELSAGAELTVNLFRPGDLVNIAGTTKGRGFQGVIKRHGKHGGPGSHGSDFHRRPGSIGMRTQPGRVHKNTRLPGHMGQDRVTVLNLLVVEVRPADHLLFVRGAVPGARNGVVEVLSQDAAFYSRRADAGDGSPKGPAPSESNEAEAGTAA